MGSPNERLWAEALRSSPSTRNGPLTPAWQPASPPAPTRSPYLPGQGPPLEAPPPGWSLRPRRTSLRPTPSAPPPAACRTCSTSAGGPTAAWARARGEESEDDRSRVLGYYADGASNADHAQGEAYAGVALWRGSNADRSGNGWTGEGDVLLGRASGEGGMTGDGLGLRGEASAVGLRGRATYTSNVSSRLQASSGIEGTLGYAGGRTEFLLGDNGGDRVGLGAGAQLEAEMGKASLSQRWSYRIPGTTWSVEAGGNRDITAGSIGGGGGAAGYYSKKDARYHGEIYGSVMAGLGMAFDTSVSVGPAPRGR